MRKYSSRHYHELIVLYSGNLSAFTKMAEIKALIVTKYKHVAAPKRYTQASDPKENITTKPPRMAKCQASFLSIGTSKIGTTDLELEKLRVTNL